MDAKELIKKYKVEKHIENGLFIEMNEDKLTDYRASSGYIYYDVSPGEITKFHEIGSDEYWSYNAGSSLEIWLIRNGEIKKMKLGIEDGDEPTILLKKGDIFASKLSNDKNDGTFITCLTVPRFTYEGFRLYEDKEIINKYPDVKEFF